MSEPVTIVIPCFNAESTIARAISSALNQTYDDLEIIVIDDGSTDSSLEVIRSFGARVAYDSGSNRGGSVARNLGIRMATGRLIQFLDADDELLPECVARKVDFVRENPGVTPVCDSENVTLNGSTVISRKLLHDRHETIEDVIYDLIRFNPNVDHPLHSRAELLNVGGFNETLKAGQDYDLHLRLGLNGVRFRRLPEVLVRHFSLAGSVSSQGKLIADTYANIFRSWGEWAIERSHEPLRRELSSKIAQIMLRRIELGCRSEDLSTDLQLARQLHPKAWRTPYSRKSLVHRCLTYTNDPIFLDIKMREFRDRFRRRSP